MGNNPIEILKSLHNIPNAPFSIKGRSEYLKKFIQDMELEYEETEYYIKVNLNSVKKDSPKIIFVSHLDHPGFVFKNSRFAKAFGSLYLHKITKYSPISVFNPQGKYLGDVKLKKVLGNDESWIEVESEFEIPKNSQGLWNVGDVEVKAGKVFARSHDNDVATSILLSNLKPTNRDDFGIVYLFTKHEEVLQQSAYHIAKYNTLGINSQDIVINTEAMKVSPISEVPEFSEISYADGPVLNISEASGLYTTGSRNLGESLINNISISQNLKLQRGLAGGSSDARVFSLFKLTPNVITLNIPNKYKHNVDGNFVRCEEVYLEDIEVINRIVNCIVDSKELSISSTQVDISHRIPEGIVKDSKGLFKNLNDRLDIANRSIVKRGYYFPSSVSEYMVDTFLKIVSFASFYLTSGKGSGLSKD
ncbi:MAG TPA: hypothetical protein PLV59_02220 [Candidatus Dojkabacteria bacterium]|nr:hypothetical protein [Candidatus Dojkabacteria bacterium]